MKAVLKTTGAAAALLAIAGCASTDFHYSKLDGRRYYQAPIDTYPVLVTKVDGKSTMPSTPALVEPGPRVVAVQTLPDHLHRFGEERTINLEVKPCTHYYLVAVKPTRVATDFTVKIDHEEPVSGCTPPPAK
ncbi:hypothetical protein [Piscinibacter sp. XHJ-5]|uniref:hypothetical protein n=1 Tax=Piscinibacter sp. XHJ-5 TaxID=3037797 RepID=UPI002452FD8A|nr:hypothetical protein [Piscinibacter sp. XHJ-5]